jgi:formyltetrahydrofolate synthetase
VVGERIGGCFVVVLITTMPSSITIFVCHHFRLSPFCHHDQQQKDAAYKHESLELLSKGVCNMQHHVKSAKKYGVKVKKKKKK